MDMHKTLSSFLNEVRELGLVQNKLAEKIIVKKVFLVTHDYDPPAYCITLFALNN